MFKDPANVLLFPNVFLKLSAVKLGLPGQLLNSLKCLVLLQVGEEGLVKTFKVGVDALENGISDV